MEENDNKQVNKTLNLCIKYLIMQKAIEILNKTQFGFLATIYDGKPRVRPFHFQFAINHEFYFCTNSEKEVYKQLIENPFVEFSVFNKAFEYVIISGEVKFSDDIKLKQKVISNNPFYKDLFGSAKNDKMILFSISNPTLKYGRWGEYPPETIHY